MTQEPGSEPPLKVLHVVATDTLRGSEVFAGDLMKALRGCHVQQEVAILNSTAEPQVTFPVPVHRLDGKVTAPPLMALALRRAVRAVDPLVVQAHGGDALKYAVSATAGIGTKVVYRRIGGAPPWTASGWRRNFHGALMRRADHVVIVAEQLRKETHELFKIEDEAMTMIPNAVDLERLSPHRPAADVRREVGIPEDSIVVISVGGLVWEKDPMAHLSVTAALFADHPRLVHVFLGDGVLRPALERSVADGGLEGRVVLLGARPEVADVLNASDVLLFASRAGGMEGMPAAVIEAGLLGLPVVGYGLAGVPEVVVDGETGCLVQAGDVEALRRALGGLLSDDEKRRRLGKQGRRRCLPRFTIEPVANRYLETWRRTVAH